MNKSESLPWNEINNFILDLENILEPVAFYKILLNNLHNFISYDQARIYELDINGKIINTVVIKVDQWWSDAYIQYYSKISKKINSDILELKKDNTDSQKCRVVNWDDYKTNEFVKEYINPQGIKYTLAFEMKNIINIAWCGLDKISGSKFTTEETQILDLLHPHLQNLYQNLPLYKSYKKEIDERMKNILTVREKEIADLLVKGITPSHISELLFISQATVYRHIANIHLKLKVSNRQELILKLISYN